jgi:hypothetical protein
MKTLRERLPREFPGVTFFFQPADIVGQILNFGLPAPIDVQVTGFNQQATREVALEVAARMEPGDVLVHEGPLENSGALEWYSGVRPVIVDGGRSVLAFGASRPESAEAFWDAARLAVVWRGERRVWLVTGRRPAASLVGTLPAARLIASGGGRRLYVNR